VFFDISEYYNLEIGLKKKHTRLNFGSTSFKVFPLLVLGGARLACRRQPPNHPLCRPRNVGNVTADIQLVFNPAQRQGISISNWFLSRKLPPHAHTQPEKIVKQKIHKKNNIEEKQ